MSVSASHNPSIPLSGDAELMNVFVTEGYLKTFGSMDHDEIVQDIIDLLEGGRDAFEKRLKRYQKFF